MGASRVPIIISMYKKVFKRKKPKQVTILFFFILTASSSASNNESGAPPAKRTKKASGKAPTEPAVPAAPAPPAKLTVGGDTVEFEDDVDIFSQRYFDPPM